jgi:uncharacterized protein
MQGKFKLFTHTDLDGIGCAIVAYDVIGRENVDVTYCDYHTIDDKISEFLNDKESLEQYTHVFITDISVNAQTAHDLYMMNDLYGPSFITLLDHHESAEWLNKFDWAHVSTKHPRGDNSCGSTLLAFQLQENGHDVSPSLLSFVEIVRRYDTWDWFNIHKDDAPKQWNDLLWLYGRDRFIDKVCEQLSNVGVFLDETDFRFLTIEQEKIDRYVSKSLKKLIVQPIGKYQVGIVFGEQYINEVSHAIHTEHPTLDLVAVVNMRSGGVSYRTQREDIDVGKFAKYFGGGGRAQTAGSQISNHQLKHILGYLFE